MFVKFCFLLVGFQKIKCFCEVLHFMSGFEEDRKCVYNFVLVLWVLRGQSVFINFCI